MARQKGLKMKDLATATGLPKSTILHYIAEGLLPKPLRTGRNVAYYDPASIDRVRLIRQMQKHKRLSLSEIKGIVEKVQDPRELEALLLLGDTVFGEGEGGRRHSREELLALSGLEPDRLDRLLAASLIVPLGVEGFDEEDLAMAKVFARAFSMGLDVSDFLYYPRLGEELVDNDFALRERITSPLQMTEDAALTMEMTRNARLARIYVFERIFRRRVASMASLKG
jgi:DNA-binding transcriptional MerR regulator